LQDIIIPVAKLKNDHLSSKRRRVKANCSSLSSRFSGNGSRSR
jgi:hypothetical protein